MLWDLVSQKLHGALKGAKRAELMAREWGSREKWTALAQPIQHPCGLKGWEVVEAHAPPSFGVQGLRGEDERYARYPKQEIHHPFG